MIGSLPVVVGILLAAKVLAARYFMLGHALGVGVVADMLAVVAVVALCQTFSGRYGRKSLAVIHTALSLTLLVGVVYASYFEQVPSLGSLVFAGQALDLARDAVGLFRAPYLVFVIDLPFVLIKAFDVDVHRRDTEADIRRPLALSGVSLAVVALFAVGATRTADVGDTIRASYTHGIVGFEVSSLMPRRDRKTEAVAQSKSELLQRQIDTMIGRDTTGRRPSAPAPGALAGKNVILVQVEALQGGLIGASVNGQEITPHLNRLVGESLYFPNMYSQIGRGNTSDAEFISNTGLYPCSDQASAVAYAGKELPGLPRLLGAMGYDTFTMHANDAKFWNRFQLYPALGFSSYYDRAYFGDEDFLAFGASDYVFFDKALAVLVQAQEADRPFYAQLVTASSHYPFANAAARGSLLLPADQQDTQTGQYLRAMSYADEQLGWFMERLKMCGMLEDTVVVIYGDHFGMRYEDETPVDVALRQQLLGHNYSRAEFYNVPLIIRSDALPTGVDTTVLGQVDIMPTVADLLGVDLTKTPNFGRSAFVDTPTMLTRPSSHRLYIDDEVFYLAGLTASDGRWYSPTDQVKQPAGAEPSGLATTSELLRLSDAYVRQLPDREDATGEIGHVPYLNQSIEQTPFR